jgi:hypothetical protein
VRLEKIADARDERESKPKSVREKHPSEMTLEELSNACSSTMWRQFLMPGSVALMGVKIDEALKRVDVMHHLTLCEPSNCIGIPAPWLDEETGSPRST